VKSYRLSQKADQDLQGIFRYTTTEHSIEQATAYLTSLEECLLLLAENPGLAQSVDEIREGYRRYLHQSHANYFVIRDHYIFVVRVLHQQMKARIHLA
jgi:toxin ParE1/3/4